MSALSYILGIFAVNAVSLCALFRAVPDSYTTRLAIVLQLLLVSIVGSKLVGWESFPLNLGCIFYSPILTLVYLKYLAKGSEVLHTLKDIM